MPKLKQFDNKNFSIDIGKTKIFFANNPSQKTYIKNRMDRMLSKEPETIDWINKFEKNSLFFDVGANVGIYTLYAAIIKGSFVYAFEPHASSYKNLLDSINMNNLQNVKAFPIALGDKLSLSDIDVKNMHEGVAENVVGKKGDFYHGCVEFSLDFMVQRKLLSQPDYVKIDVDGYENKVIEGAVNTLKNCKGCLVEINNVNKNCVAMLTDLGLRLKGQHKRNDREFNYIFEND